MVWGSTAGSADCVEAACRFRVLPRVPQMMLRQLSQVSEESLAFQLWADLPPLSVSLGK